MRAGDRKQGINKCDYINESVKLLPLVSPQS